MFEAIRTKKKGTTAIKMHIALQPLSISKYSNLIELLVVHVSVITGIADLNQDADPRIIGHILIDYFSPNIIK